MQIPPKYTITSEILQILAAIEAKRIYFSSLSIPLPIQEKIKRVSLLKSSLFSARIEGNPLNLPDLNKTQKDDEKNARYLISKKLSYKLYRFLFKK